MEFKHDPANYRKLSEPRALAEANKALTAFQEELYELRKKHGIRDLMFVVQVPVIHGEGEEAFEDDPICCGHFGEPRRMVELAAYALGTCRERTETAIAAMTKRGSRSK